MSGKVLRLPPPLCPGPSAPSLGCLLPLVSSCPRLPRLMQGTWAGRKSHRAVPRWLRWTHAQDPTVSSGPPQSPSRQRAGRAWVLWPALPSACCRWGGKLRRVACPPALSAHPDQSPACQHLSSLPGGVPRAQCQAPDDTPEYETAHLPGAPCVFKPGRAEWAHGVTAKEQPPRACVQVGMGATLCLGPSAECQCSIPYLRTRGPQEQEGGSPALL